MSRSRNRRSRSRYHWGQYFILFAVCFAGAGVVAKLVFDELVQVGNVRRLWHLHQDYQSSIDRLELQIRIANESPDAQQSPRALEATMYKIEEYAALRDKVAAELRVLDPDEKYKPK